MPYNPDQQYSQDGHAWVNVSYRKIQKPGCIHLTLMLTSIIIALVLGMLAWAKV